MWHWEYPVMLEFGVRSDWRSGFPVTFDMIDNYLSLGSPQTCTTCPGPLENEQC